jgi:hypothetical protein
MMDIKMMGIDDAGETDTVSLPLCCYREKVVVLGEQHVR